MNWQSRRLAGIRSFLCLGAFLVFASVPCGAEQTPERADATPDFSAQYEALKRGSAVDAETQLEAFCQHLDLASVLAWLDFLEERKGNAQSDFLRPYLVKRWAEFAGAEAFAFAATWRTADRLELMSVALAGWAGQDPEAAWQGYMTSAGSRPDPRLNSAPIFGALGANNVLSTLDKLLDLPPERTCLVCLANNLMYTVFRDGQEALVWRYWMRMRPGPHKAAVGEAWWRMVGELSPQTGLDFLARVPEVDRALAQEHFFRGWAQGDFGVAYDYVMTHYEGDMRDALVVPVLTTWANSAPPGEVSELLALLPDNLSDRSLRPAVQTFARINPQATVAWAEVIRDNNLRLLTLKDTVDVWCRQDPEPARAYIAAREDLGLKGHLLWAFVFARLDNRTLVVSDLEAIDERFNHRWTVSFLGRVVASLADPRSGAATFIDQVRVSAYVQGRSDLTSEEKAEILGPWSR